MKDGINLNWFYNLKMKKKLIYSFLLLTFFTIMIAIFGIVKMRSINESNNSMYKRDVIAIKAVSEIKANLIQINYDLYVILKERDPGKNRVLSDEIFRLRDNDDDLLLQYKNAMFEEEDYSRYNEFNKILKEYRSNWAIFITFVNDNKYAEAEKIYPNLNNICNEIVGNINEYIKYNEKLAKLNYDSSLLSYRQTLIFYILIVVLGIIIAILLGNFIATIISNQLEKVVKFAKEIGEGELSTAIDIETKDEIGILSKILNKSVSIRREYELKLENNYQELEASYEEITALETDLREKYQELESSFEEITALEEELREKYNELSISEENLRLSDEWHKLITEASRDVLWDWYVNEDKINFSEQWHSILKDIIKIGDPVEKWTNIVHNEDLQSLRQTIYEHWRSKSDIFSVIYRMKAGENYIWIQTTGKTLYDKNGQPYRVAGSHKDVTEMINYQEKLEKIAYHDYLTNLPNRQYMYKRLLNDYGIENENFKSAVIFIDIDNFKYINDTMGHSYGDSLIIAISERLQNNIRKVDTLVRLGGDEFVIFLKDIINKEQVEKFANAILKQFSNPFEICENNINVTTSIGISLYPDNGKSMDELLKKADIAMYRSKYEGKNSYTFFVDNMDEEIVEKMNIDKNLRKAIDNEEFILHYQPQVEVKSGEITGFEALIRWNSPELGFIPPDKFIGIAEENHMIIEMGHWILKTACKFIKKINDERKADCYISVNTSVLELMQSNFADNIYNTLKAIDLSPSSLELEITESIFIYSYDAIKNNIDALKAMGVKIALDDFGKGYSSLSYLKQIPIDTLKIDKSFIDDINEGIESSLVEDIIAIGHKMDLKVIAEGVEDNCQLEYLSKFACDKIQGYLFSKPVPEEAAFNLNYRGK